MKAFCDYEIWIPAYAGMAPPEEFIQGELWTLKISNPPLKKGALNELRNTLNYRGFFPNQILYQSMKISYMSLNFN